jgi:capsular polysaccharide biosynthesis protein
MYYPSFIASIRKSFSAILFAGLVGGALTFFALIVIPDAYKVRTDFLIIQKTAASQDFYTLSKSAEYSGNVLKEAILSDLFYQEALVTGYFSDTSFVGDERARLKKWQNTVSVSQRTTAGILEVAILNDNRSEAVGIARAISEVLIGKNDMFRSGTAEDLSIKRISGPIVESNPSVTQLILGVFGGIIFGGALFVLWIWYRLEFEEKDYSVFLDAVGNYTDDSIGGEAVYKSENLENGNISFDRA